jgi:hypothetical protein
LTNGRELESILLYVLAKRGGLSVKDLDVKKFYNFIQAIQGGYLNITYHNKTHGADLCQTINYFLTEGGNLGQLSQVSEL